MTNFEMKDVNTIKPESQNYYSARFITRSTNENGEHTLWMYHPEGIMFGGSNSGPVLVEVDLLGNKSRSVSEYKFTADGIVQAASTNELTKIRGFKRRSSIAKYLEASEAMKQEISQTNVQTVLGSSLAHEISYALNTEPAIPSSLNYYLKLTFN